ncbi:MAG: exodeoxyribonuclease VII small subunit [Christensenellaceae bacterium]|nr:exodeoxyribonuclease VII small subunit [Christensenellaceae bacterium]
MAAKKKQTFEEQLAGVEKLISQMENGGMTLEESLKSYEEGMKALTALEKELAEATQRVTVLRRNTEGEDEEIPLEEDV